jgi:hypothetical protein
MLQVLKEDTDHQPLLNDCLFLKNLLELQVLKLDFLKQLSNWLVFILKFHQGIKETVLNIFQKICILVLRVLFLLVHVYQIKEYLLNLE